jgi:hypothetical protein
VTAPPGDDAERSSPWPASGDAPTERSRTRPAIVDVDDGADLRTVIEAINRLHAAVAASALRIEDVAAQVDQLLLLVLGGAAPAAGPAAPVPPAEDDDRPQLAEVVQQLRAEVAAVAEVVVEGLDWMRQRGATSREVQALADRLRPPSDPQG